MIVAYKEQQAKCSDIEEHLSFCDDLFIPRLSSYVNINVYSKKIIENAFTFEAWNNEKLIGLVAAYINPNETAFITNVSVLKKYSNAGIAKVLITMCIKKAVTMKIAQIDLEVNKSSVNAIKLYKKIGLMKINEDKTTIKMSYRIRDK